MGRTESLVNRQVLSPAETSEAGEERRTQAG